MSGTALIRYQRLRQDSLGRFLSRRRCTARQKTPRGCTLARRGKSLRRPRSALECAAAHSIYLAGDELRDKKNAPRAWMTAIHGRKGESISN